METENAIWKLTDSLRTIVPSSAVEDFTRKLAFTYYLYFKLKGFYPTRGLNNTVDDLKESIKTMNDYGVFRSEKDMVEAISSWARDFDFFGNENPGFFDQYQMFQDILSGFDQNGLLFLLNYPFFHSHRDDSTPASVSELVLHLSRHFGVEEGYRVTDMTCAKGDFLLKAAKYFDHVEGVEINHENALIAKMRLYANGISGDIRNKDCFVDSWSYQNNSNKSNLVFAEFPWKLIVKDPKQQKVMFNCNANTFFMNYDSTTDFFFLSAMMNYLDRDNGLAMAIVPLSTLSNLSDMKIREGIVEMGLLKAVISLPNNLFSRTSISTALVVLSLKPSDKVIFFDGSSYCHQENRQWNVIDVEYLVNALKEAELIQKCQFDKVILKKHDYSFSPARYLSNIESLLPNATELEKVAEIFTGWQVTSAKLENIHKTDGTGTLLLQMSNVEKGNIVERLEKYEIPENTVERFKVQKGDVVISTKSLKVKSAVVDIDTEEPIIASGSIMVIKPFAKVIDPYYLVAYFESDLGQQALKMYQTGIVIPNLSISNVKKLPIPLLPFEKQVKVGKEYRDLRDLIFSEKERLKLLQVKVNTMFDRLWDNKKGE